MQNHGVSATTQSNPVSGDVLWLDEGSLWVVAASPSWWWRRGGHPRMDEKIHAPDDQILLGNNPFTCSRMEAVACPCTAITHAGVQNSKSSNLLDFMLP